MVAGANFKLGIPERHSKVKFRYNDTVPNGRVMENSAVYLLSSFRHNLVSAKLYIK